MARHVLHGEFPAFFWGQAFKGVPEVYASAVAFAAFGPSVVVLKSVTLVFFAAYVALNFVLLDTIGSRWLAVAASLLLIVAPPALVFWSLDASAEYIVLMLLGTILLLLSLKYQRKRSTLIAVTLGVVVGLGLWVQQLFVLYLVPIAVVSLSRTGWWKERGPAAFARELVTLPDRSLPTRMLIRSLVALSVVLLALGLVAFLSGGFAFDIGTIQIGARAPQKLLRQAGAAATIALLLYAATTRSSKRNLVAFERTRVFCARFAAGFLVGYSPVLLYSFLVEPSHSPARNANLSQLVGAASDIAGNILAIIFGVKIATTERLPIPLIAFIPGIAALVAYIWSSRRRFLTDFFPLFVVFVPLLFLVSGAYLDTQSYRYLIPWYAGLCVAWAGGAWWLVRGNAAWASALVGIILAVHLWQQVIWYRKLTPDAVSAATIDCLRRGGIRGGYADYWTSYTLTFLSNEDIIIAPTDGVDRYPAYTEFVGSLPEGQKVRLTPDTTMCR